MNDFWNDEPEAEPAVWCSRCDVRMRFAEDAASSGWITGTCPRCGACWIGPTDMAEVPQPAKRYWIRKPVAVALFRLGCFLEQLGQYHNPQLPLIKKRQAEELQRLKASFG